MNSTLTAPDGNSSSALRADVTTISVVGLVHATAHLFQLPLPRLFPRLATECSLSFAELGTGVAGPLRDLLIKHSTPAGATGRVYGKVYSGLNAGLAVSAQGLPC